ncbi:hypothetical protein PFISCL1PPCAC_13316, partial [Pristionchus fissidentatus]
GVYCASFDDGKSTVATSLLSSAIGRPSLHHTASSSGSTVVSPYDVHSQYGRGGRRDDQSGRNENKNNREHSRDVEGEGAKEGER